MSLAKEDIISILGLEPLPQEGGYFRETYRSNEQIKPCCLPQAADKTRKRSFSTAIYYLITDDSFSALHRISSDEVFHFYLGDPVEMVAFSSHQAPERTVLGSDLLAGQRPQFLVKKNLWQGARLIPGGSYALLGTTVSPGFDFDDFEVARFESIFPEFEEQKELLLPYLATGLS